MFKSKTDRTKNMMNDMREQLAESERTEKDLSINLREQIDRRDALAKKLKETLAAIEAQRIPGTKEVLFTGKIIFKNEKGSFEEGKIVCVVFFSLLQTKNT